MDKPGLVLLTALLGPGKPSRAWLHGGAHSPIHQAQAAVWQRFGSAVLKGLWSQVS